MTARRPPERPTPTRHVVAAALALLVLGTLGAIQAGRAGASFMLDLEQVTPPLARHAPTIAPSLTPRLARRVFVVIVDGLGFNESFELPFLDSLRRRGVDAEAIAHYPTWSRPNYVAILTGVPPTASGVRTNHHHTPVPLDSLMDRANAVGLVVASAADYDVLPRLFLRRRGDRSVITEVVDEDAEDQSDELDAFDDPETAAAVAAPAADLVSPFHDARYAPWPGGFSEAGAAVVAGNSDLVILLVGAVDVAGHAHGSDSPQYRDASLRADHALSRALASVDLAHDTVVVVADHGHTARGGHGGVEPEVTSVPLILAGAAVAANRMPQAARLIDVAPTVAALLGIPAPGHGLGRTLTEVLAISDDARANLRARDDARLAVTRAIVAHAELAAGSDVREHRAWRLALIAAGAATAIALAVLLRRRRVLRFDLRVLVVTVPVFFVVYYGLIGTLGQRFSPSLVPAQGHLGSALLRYVLVATAIQLLANLWALRTRPTLDARLAAANGTALIGLMLAMVPAGVVWAFFPPPYVSLPGPTWLVLIPALELAVAGAAITFAATLAIEVVVFAARAWQPARPRTSPRDSVDG